MAKYRIKKSGPLQGTVPISGSKNASLALVAAAMAADGVSTLENLPHISDLETLFDICRDCGAIVTRINATTVSIDPRPVTNPVAIHENVRQLRGSYYLLGAFLGKFGRAQLALPGGCDFGARPIDLHLKGFAALGADDEEQKAGMITLATSRRRLKGASIFLDTVSVGATINIMLAAVHARGTTVIDNTAKEPHVVDCANFLNAMGASVRGAGTDVIKIAGSLHLPAGRTYAVIPDQIEAGTYMMMAPLTHGDITVTNVIPKHMESLTAKLLEMGAEIEEGDDSIRVNCMNRKLKAISVKTMPYPGFPTDLQPQMVTLLTQAAGTSRVIENVWENRFQYIEQLKAMGAKITTTGKLANIVGKEPMGGMTVTARDLRAGAAVAMAGLVAEGTTIVDQIETIERGYEDFVQKMRNIGADIEEIPE